IIQAPAKGLQGLDRAADRVLAIHGLRKGAGQAARLLVAVLGEDIAGAGAAGETRLLAGRRYRGKGGHKDCQRIPGKTRIAAEVIDEQGAIDTDIKIEYAGAETGVANETGAGILGRILQVVDGSVIVLLNGRLVGREGMRHLDSRLAVELRGVR